MPLSWLQAAAATHEWLHGPLPDVVQTQGKHLLSRPSTPTYSRAPDPDFVEKLHASLDSLINAQNPRNVQSGENLFEECPIGHTPQEFRPNWAEEHTVVDSWDDELPPTPSEDDGSIQLSTVSGRTLTIHKHTPAPEHTLPILKMSKHDIGGIGDKLTSSFRSASLRRISRLGNTNCVETAQSLIETIQVKPSSTGDIKISRKRRLSDIENTPPVELRRSKRRIVEPHLHTLVGVS